MTNCTFCGGDVVPGTGKMYIKRDGTVWNFCKAKCQRNQVDLGRVNRHVGWTQAYAEHKGDRQSTQAVRDTKAATKRSAKAEAKPKAAAKAAPKAEAAPKA